MNAVLLRRVQKEIVRRGKVTMADPQRCIGGVALELAGYEYIHGRWHNGAGEIVAWQWAAEAEAELTPEQGDALFLVSNWPREFRSQYWNCSTEKEAVRAAVARIDAFLSGDVGGPKKSAAPVIPVVVDAAPTPPPFGNWSVWSGRRRR